MVSVETMTTFRPLGPSGLRVSTIGLGCNNLGRAGTATETLEGVTALIDAAIESGVTFFDTADVYGKERGLSETLLGKALKGRREQVVLATKFGHDMEGANGPDWGARGSRRYIRLAVEASLKRLGTDWIDLYQYHFPDAGTPIEETLSALDDLVREGKVRYLGHSNLAGWQIAEAEFTARELGSASFVSAQNLYSLAERGVEQEVLPAVRAYGLGFLPFFPLHHGLLTGKYTRTVHPDGARLTALKPDILETVDWDRLQAYQVFCEERGVTMLEASFAWLLAQPGVASVIAGATRPEQIRQNAAAGSSWSPDADDIEAISAIFAPA